MTRTEFSKRPGMTYTCFGTLSQEKVTDLISRWEALALGNVAVKVNDYYVFLDKEEGDSVGYEFINAFLSTILTVDGELL